MVTSEFSTRLFQPSHSQKLSTASRVGSLSSIATGPTQTMQQQRAPISNLGSPSLEQRTAPSSTPAHGFSTFTRSHGSSSVIPNNSDSGYNTPHTCQPHRAQQDYSPTVLHSDLSATPASFLVHKRSRSTSSVPSTTYFTEAHSDHVSLTSPGHASNNSAAAVNNSTVLSHIQSHNMNSGFTHSSDFHHDARLNCAAAKQQQTHDHVPTTFNSANSCQTADPMCDSEQNSQYAILWLFIRIMNFVLCKPLLGLFSFVLRRCHGTTDIPPRQQHGFGAHITPRQPERARACITPHCACQLTCHAQPAPDVNIATPRVPQPHLTTPTEFPAAPGFRASHLPLTTELNASPAPGYRVPQPLSATPHQNFACSHHTGVSTAPASNASPTLDSSPSATTPMHSPSYTSKLPSLPEFDPAAPDLWFNLVEQLLDHYNLSDRSRYLCLIAHFNKHKEYVYELLRNPPTQNCYQTAKKYILGRVLKYGSECVMQRLYDMRLGDNSPSQLWIRMRTMSQEEHLSDEMLFQIWLAKLPYTVQPAATSLMDKPPSERITPTDRAFLALQAELSSQPSDNRKPSSGRSSRSKHRATDDVVDGPSSSSRSSSPISSTRSSSPPPDSQVWCYYHRTFGDKAQKCQSPCFHPNAIACNASNKSHAFLHSVSTNNTRSRLYVTDTTSGERFLVDTGADVSLLPLGFRGPQLRPHKAQLMAVNSSPLSCIGSMDCDVCLSPACSLRGTFYIADVSEPILGVDFLRKHGLSISMATNTVSHDATGATFVCSSVNETSTSPDLRMHLADVCVSLSRAIETTSAEMLAEADQRRNLQRQNDDLRNQLSNKTAELSALHHRIDMLQLRRSTDTTKVSAVIPEVVDSVKVPPTSSVTLLTSAPLTSVAPAFSQDAIHPTSDLSTCSPSSDGSFKHFPPLATSKATKRHKRHVTFKLAPDVFSIPAREPVHKSQPQKQSSTRRDGKSNPAKVSAKRTSHKSDYHTNSSVKRSGTSKPAQVALQRPASKQPVQPATTVPCATNNGQLATPTQQAPRLTAQPLLAAVAHQTRPPDQYHAPGTAVTPGASDQSPPHADTASPPATGSNTPIVTNQAVQQPNSTDVPCSDSSTRAQPHPSLQPRIATLMDHASQSERLRHAYQTILLNTLDLDSDSDLEWN